MTIQNDQAAQSDAERMYTEAAALQARHEDMIPREDHNTAMAAMRERLQTAENMLHSERVSKRQALRRAEAAEKLNQSLMENVRSRIDNA